MNSFCHELVGGICMTGGAVTKESFSAPMVSLRRLVEALYERNCCRFE